MRLTSIYKPKKSARENTFDCQSKFLHILSSDIKLLMKWRGKCSRRTAKSLFTTNFSREIWQSHDYNLSFLLSLIPNYISLYILSIPVSPYLFSYVRTIRANFFPRRKFNGRDQFFSHVFKYVHNWGSF